MSIENVIKQPGPVGAGLAPIQSGQGRSVPVGAGAGWCRCRLVPVPVPVVPVADRCRPMPTGVGAVDRPQETLYLSKFKL
jgi:hypothetical protein